MRETGSGFPEPGGTTEPLQPRTERVEPVNFPYRGQEQHGVEVKGKPWIPQDAGEESWDGEEAFEEEPPEIVPVPVRIVSESAGELRSWRAFQGVATTAVSLLAGQNENRTSIRIKNMEASGGSEIYIGHTVQVGSLYGYPLAPQESVELATEEEVYVIAESGADPVSVAVILTHAVQ